MQLISRNQVGAGLALTLVLTGCSAEHPQATPDHAQAAVWSLETSATAGSALVARDAGTREILRLTCLRSPTGFVASSPDWTPRNDAATIELEAGSARLVLVKTREPGAPVVEGQAPLAQVRAEDHPQRKMTPWSGAQPSSPSAHPDAHGSTAAASPAESATSSLLNALSQGHPIIARYGSTETGWLVAPPADMRSRFIQNCLGSAKPDDTTVLPARKAR